jgi:hypothetical protein
MVREILKKACSSQISCGDSWELNAVSQEKKWEKLENIYYLRNYSHSLLLLRTIPLSYRAVMALLPHSTMGCSGKESHLPKWPCSWDHSD